MAAMPQLILRRAALLGLAAALSTGVVACGDDDDGDSGDSGGSLTVQYFEFESFDPHVSAAAADWGAEGMVFRGLYKLDRENRPEPELADGMPEISDDGLTYTVDLKEGLTWSDGTALEAGDFVAGIVRTCAPDWQSYYAGVIGNITGCLEYQAATEATDTDRSALEAAIGVKAVDADTLEFTLANAQPTFTTILTLPATWPVPTHIVDGAGAEWPQPADLVFNGPYTVESYKAGDSMVFTRNDAYGGERRASIGRVTFRYIEEASQANNAFRSGEILVARADKSVLGSLTQEFEDELVAGQPTTSVGLAMQMEREPLDNFDFRLALSRATDRERIATEILAGAGLPTTSWTPASILQLEGDPLDFDDDIGFDPDAARESMAAAGFPDGEGAPELELLIRDDAANRDVAQFLQQQWKEILGIDIRIETADTRTGISRILEGDFDLTYFPWGHDYPDPESWMQGLFNTGGGMNLYRCSNDEIDGLLEAAQFNTDDDERREQYTDVNELISSELCGITPMYFLAEQYLVSPDVTGPKEYSSSQDRILPGDWAVEEWKLKD